MKQKVPEVWRVPRNKKSSKNSNLKLVTLNGCMSTEPTTVSKKITPRRTQERQFEVLLADLQGRHIFRPNFEDARVKKRLRLVLDWCLRNRNKNRASKQTLNKVFGQGQHAVSHWLRTRLLSKCCGHNRTHSRSAEWKVNERALAEIWQLTYNRELDIDRETEQAWTRLAEGYGRGPFEYSEPVIGGRRYHELQQLPRALRSSVWNGWYEYDLSAANVTLITQLATAHDELLQTPRLDRYLANKSHDRAIMERLFNITPAQVKELVQCVISLAAFTTNEFSHAYSIMSHDKFHELVNHPYFQGMRAEITECWKRVLPDAWSNGTARFRVYEEVERRIMNAVETHLKGKHYLLQHDGLLLMERTPLDLQAITESILAQTGYTVSIEETAL